MESFRRDRGDVDFIEVDPKCGGGIRDCVLICQCDRGRKIDNVTLLGNLRRTKGGEKNNNKLSPRSRASPIGSWRLQWILKAQKVCYADRTYIFNSACLIQNWIWCSFCYQFCVASNCGLWNGFGLFIFQRLVSASFQVYTRNEFRTWSRGETLNFNLKYGVNGRRFA